VIGFTLMFLNDNYTTYHARTYAGFDVAAEDRRLTEAGKPDEIALGSAKHEHHGKAWDVVYVREDQLDPAAPAGERKVLVPRGKYLADAGRIAYYVDPGVCGTEKIQYAADGTTVERNIESKFDAPKAQLFRLIIDGVLGGGLPWALVLTGVFIAIMMELCGVPALPFAVGAYLPISTSTSIFLGGLARKWADKRSGLTEQEQESSPGVLFSSGLIAGGALIGILVCGLQGPTKETQADGTQLETTWEKKYDLELSHRVFPETETVAQSIDRFKLETFKPVFGEDTLAMSTRSFLNDHAGWGFGWFFVLALFLFLVAMRRPKRPAAAASPPGPAPPG
jgi:hypothetical protein